MNKSILRLLCAMLMITLLAGAMPSALADSSFKAVVTSKTMKVYSQKSPYSVIGTLSKGDVVTVKKYSGKAALISYKGKTGIARVSDLSKVTESDSQTTETTQEDTTASTATQSSETKTVVTTKAAKLYKKASTKSRYVKLKAGTKLTLLSTNGNVAKVKRGSTVGYIDARCLSDADSESGTTSEQSTSQTTSGTVQEYDRKAVVTTQACKVYATPSPSGSYVSVEKGTQLVLLATKGSLAMVERNGIVGYMDKSNLSEASSSSASDSAVRTADNTADNSVDLSGNNEQIVYKFLTKVMGYNTAAACGVMANIKYESGYKPTAGGDSGSSYGIVQWHLGRKTRLISWCETNGFDYTTLEGQLYYLEYELKNRYPAVHKRLQAVSNDEQGAYDAGYDFCYNFEAPSNRASKAVTRGNYARDTLWNRYKT